MTVREFIEMLNQLDSDKEIWIRRHGESAAVSSQPLHVHLIDGHKLPDHPSNCRYCQDYYELVLTR